MLGIGYRVHWFKERSSTINIEYYVLGLRYFILSIKCWVFVFGIGYQVSGILVQGAKLLDKY